MTDLPIFLLTVVLLTGHVTASCNDTASRSCYRLQQTQPNLCHGTLIGNTSCAAFCAHCSHRPLHCYTCTDPDNCTSGMQCSDNELCMRKTKTSSVDGHKEYILKCATPVECDGESVFTIVGRREISNRNLHITCCSTDMCNTPLVPHSTSSQITPSPTTDSTLPITPTFLRPDVKCQKDVAVYVQGKSYSLAETAHLIQLVTNVIDGTEVSSDGGMQLSFAKFAAGRPIQRIWNLNTYQSKPSLLNAVNHLNFAQGHHEMISFDKFVYAINTDTFIQTRGDRQSVPNVSLVFVNSLSHAIYMVYNYGYHVTTSDVIVVVMGPDVLNAEVQVVTKLAQNPSHVFHVGYSGLPSLTDQLINAICN